MTAARLVSFLRLAWMVPAALLATAAACSLSGPRGTGAVRLRLVGERVARYDCVFVTVSASDLAGDFDGTSVAPHACLFSGLNSALATPGDARGPGIPLTVPAGHARTFHAMGVVTGTGDCGGKRRVEDLFTGAPPIVREIGSGSTDTLATSVLHVAVAANASDDLVACKNGQTVATDPLPGTSGGFVTTWGSNGSFKADLGGLLKDDEILAVARQSDGKLILGGYAVDATGKKRGLVARLTTSGQLDTTFAAGGSTPGMLLSTFSATGNLGAEVRAVAVDTDDKIAFAGWSDWGFVATPDISTLVGRLDRDGSLDPNFAAGAGFSVQDISTGFTDQWNAVAFDASHNIVAAGYLTVSTPADRLLIARFKSTDGGFDTTGFSSPYGYESISYDQYVHANAIAILSTGDIVTAGEAHVPTEDQFHFFRVSSTGIQLANTGFHVSGANAVNDKAFAMAIQNVGGTDEILMAGTGGSPRKTFLARVLQVGTLDSSFGVSGVASLDVDATDNQARGVMLGANNSIYVAGYYGASATRGYLFKRLANGAADTSFGSGGGMLFPSFGVNGDRIWGILGDGTTQLTVVGGALDANASLDSLALKLFQ